VLRGKWIRRSTTLWEYVVDGEVCGVVKANLSCCGGASVAVGVEGVSLRGSVSGVAAAKRLVGVIVEGTGEQEARSG